MQDNKQLFWKPMLWAFTAVGSIFIFGITVMALYDPKDWKSWSELGSAFGALNTLFTALAFAAVVVSLYYQRHEIQQTLNEVDEARKGQADALEAQMKAVQAIKEQTRSFYRPYIIARIDLEKGGERTLIISNVGRTVAKNLHLWTDHDFVYPGGFQWESQGDEGKLARAYAFNNVIPTFGPGERLYFLIATGNAIAQHDPKYERHPQVFHVKATYELDGIEEPVSEMMIVDMRRFHQSFVYEERSDKALDNIFEELQKVNENLERLCGLKNTKNDR